ncbi:hypothetical protein EMIHUDRAFT_223077 [Emiliania huxleyi CCMP1516]|uniref:Uncharacterized protein n=2 Tax=Emiliania huxleyi TaxID=2903 RepID=A0A0D3KWQ9_EMIH1|nr:hypothetical protein EMIHUDRAFT_223077 [Emiliania huxleyi CCMP1516]EOD40194.1 hypothetical protein EMIHUDRAFT_223077 [Emiliania huxleyi CCMP1516]|eukprot:XP_005792623.1 hypothetical protein EMIHUDRAFT_223077 [Emiliania huxleyi CCMP1516]
MTTHVSCCKWHGITCDAEGFITKIELPFNKLAGRTSLSGTISDAIGKLDQLDHFYMEHTAVHFGKCVGISGTIPQTIAGLTRVDYIDLESTKAYHPQPAPAARDQHETAPEMSGR